MLEVTRGGRFRAVGGFQRRGRGDDPIILRIEVEHADHAGPDGVIAAVRNAVTSRIEVRVEVDVVPPDSFPKTEMKAKRIEDRRAK